VLHSPLKNPLRTRRASCRMPSDDVIAAHRLERHVPADIFTAAVGKQGVGIANGQRAQQQPLTADGVRGAQRPGMGSRHVDPSCHVRTVSLLCVLTRWPRSQFRPECRSRS
jgi:hypothetical protein